MARLKRQYRLEERRGVVLAKFYALKEKGERTPELTLCTIDEFQYKITARGKKQRTKKESRNFLDNLYQAKEKQLREEHRRKRPGKTEAERVKLASVIDDYERTILPELSASTQRSYSVQLKFWRAKGGRRSLSEITPRWIAKRRDELKRIKNAKSTVNRYLAALSVVLSACVKEWHIISSNPAQNVRRMKEPPGRVRYLSDIELSNLMRSAHFYGDLYLAVLLALTTGARQMEIWNLRREDIDLKNGFVTFSKTKSGEKRTVPVRGEALEMLRRRTPRIDTPLLFPSPKYPWKPFDFRRQFNNALKTAEISDFSWHDLRHSAASYLIRSGVNMRIAAEILGHKNLAMTKKYSHLAPDHLAEAVEKMTEKFLK